MSVALDYLGILRPKIHEYSYSHLRLPFPFPFPLPLAQGGCVCSLDLPAFVNTAVRLTALGRSFCMFCLCILFLRRREARAEVMYVSESQNEVESGS